MMHTYELEIHQVKHYYYRETVQAKNRASAFRMLQSRLDNDKIKFQLDDTEIVDAQAYKLSTL